MRRVIAVIGVLGVLGIILMRKTSRAAGPLFPKPQPPLFAPVPVLRPTFPNGTVITYRDGSRETIVSSTYSGGTWNYIVNLYDATHGTYLSNVAGETDQSLQNTIRLAGGVVSGG